MCVGIASSAAPSNYRSGLYIHIPWCISLCNYCVFFTHLFQRPAFERYFQALLAEKALYLKHFTRPLTSVYFGGGTPSLLAAGEISELLRDLPLQENAEITLEMNPLQLTPRYLEALKSTPVNRISLGLQSMLDEELSFLTRRHRAAEIPPKIALLREYGYDNFSLDLIYGLPGANLQKLARNLELVLALAPPHLSSYLLEIPDESRILKYRAKLPADELLSASYDLILETFEKAGLKQYEISNFARAGYQSSHNLLYWRQDDYLAFGAGGSAFWGGKRYTNPANLDTYYRNVEAALCFPDAVCENEVENYIMMRLRLREGLDFKDFEARFGQAFGREKALEKLIRYGMIEPFEGGIRLSKKALFISNAVISELL